MIKTKKNLFLIMGFITLSTPIHSSQFQKSIINMSKHNNNSTTQYIKNLISSTKKHTYKYIDNLIATYKSLLDKNQQTTTKHNENIRYQDEIIAASLKENSKLNDYFGSFPKDAVEKKRHHNIYNKYQKYIKEIQQPYIDPQTFTTYNDPFKRQETILFNKMIQNNLQYKKINADFSNLYNADLPKTTTNIDPYSIHGELKPEYIKGGYDTYGK